MESITTTTPIEVLRKNFGYDQFRHQQKDIISHILGGKDALVLMPTGGGKSLCYQIPALMFDGITLVISPLIALMKDQVDALRVNGISAACLNSTLSYYEQEDIMQLMRAGELKILYIAPERLTGNDGEFLKFLQTLKVSLIAIDEAHCISQWGHDFRPEYTRLSALKSNFPSTPLVALTATADQLTQDDILSQLHLKNPKKFVSSFNRENIHYFVQPKNNSYQQLLEFLDRHQDNSGIIYTLSRASAESLANNLQSDGFNALPYHAGLDKNTRDKHQDLFIKDDVRIITATIAFGMGIDKSNVRFVVHMDLPKNIEGYYQETGRAGRDGLMSETLLFYSYADVMKLRRFVEIEGNKTQSEIMLRKLQEMADFGDLRTCRRKYLLNYFDEEAPEYCEGCDNCLKDYEKFDGTVIAQKVLSAVARLGQNFGAGYLIDFLRGSRSAKIKEWHKQIKTYGVGADMTREEWSFYIKDLLHLGYLKKDEGLYPVLKLTDKSQKVLQGDEKVWLLQVEEQKFVTANQIQDVSTLMEVELFNRLKALRKKLANEEGVPPYIIFSDATLQELSSFLPLNIDDINEISGFGAVKMEKYGEVFLDEIINYCKTHLLVSRMNKKPRKARGSNRVNKEKGTGHTPTKMESLQLFKDGKNIEQIAKIRGITCNTIENHLNEFILDGTIKIDELVPKELIYEISQVIESVGGPALKPFKEQLPEDITYGQIRGVFNHLLYKKKLKENISLESM